MVYPGYKRVGGKVISFDFINKKLSRCSQFDANAKEIGAYKAGLAQLLRVDSAQIVITSCTDSTGTKAISTEIHSLDATGVDAIKAKVAKVKRT